MVEYKKISITKQAYKALVKYKIECELPTLSDTILKLIEEVKGCPKRK